LREPVGKAMQVVGLVLMPLGFLIGLFDESFPIMTELAMASVGFVLIIVGRGLRGAGPAK
jgi:hypothetical protein